MRGGVQPRTKVILPTKPLVPLPSFVGGGVITAGWPLPLLVPLPATGLLTPVLLVAVPALLFPDCADVLGAVAGSPLAALCPVYLDGTIVKRFVLAVVMAACLC